MILETTFINDLVRREPVAADKLQELIDAEAPVGISALTVFEVGIGLRGEAERHQKRYEDVIDDLKVVPFGTAAARRATAIQHELKDRGEQIGEVDVLIAGTAIERGEDVLTRNVNEFARVEGLDVETY